MQCKSMPNNSSLCKLSSLDFQDYTPFHMLFLVSHAIPNLVFEQFEQREKERERESEPPQSSRQSSVKKLGRREVTSSTLLISRLSEKNFKSPRICTTPAAYQKSIYFILHNLRSLETVALVAPMKPGVLHTQYPSPCSRCVVREASQTTFVADLNCTVKHPKSLPNIMILIQDIMCR